MHGFTKYFPHNDAEKPRVVMMPSVLSMAASRLLITTHCDAASHDKLVSWQFPLHNGYACMAICHLSLLEMKMFKFKIKLFINICEQTHNHVFIILICYMIVYYVSCTEKGLHLDRAGSKPLIIFEDGMTRYIVEHEKSKRLSQRT